MTAFTRWPSQGPNMNRLAQALEEIGRPLPDTNDSTRIAGYIRAVLGPIPYGLRAEHFAEIALHRIAQ